MNVLVPLALLLSAAAASDGLAQFRQRNFAGAERALRTTLKRNPQDQSSRLLLVRTLIELNRIPDALSELAPLAAESATEEARLEAGRILRQLAERRFRDLQRVAGGTAATLEISGRRLEREGNHPEALARYREVLKLEPDRPGIRYAIGGVLWKMQELPAAEKELRAELARHPAHGMANLRLGQVLMATERETEAIAPLEAARSALPHLPEILRELGKAYRKTNRLAEARSAWETVARARPNDDQIHYLLSGLYRELGESALAQQELQRHRTILEQRRRR